MNPLGGGPARLYLLLWAGLILLPGCQQDGPADYTDIYLQKLARALPAIRITHTATRIPEPPDAGNGGIETGGWQWGGIDILDLRECTLKKTLIRERSRLGQNAKPSQQLLLELEYLRTAPACIERLRQQGKTSLAATLEGLLARKRRDLPHRILNATLASDEYAALWAGARSPGLYPAAAHATVVSALAGIHGQVRRWLGGDYRADNLAFELLLGEMAGGKAGAHLYSLSRQHASLAAVNRQLRGEGYACDSHNRRESARLLAAARRFFLKKLQPRFAASLERLDAVHAAVISLEQQLNHVLPAHDRRWITARDRHIEAVRNAPATHLALLERARQSCARPGTRRAQTRENWLH